MTDNICVCCGEYVPEGRQVCWGCENTFVGKLKLNKKFKTISTEEALKDVIPVDWSEEVVNGKNKIEVVRYKGD